MVKLTSPLAAIVADGTPCVLCAGGTNFFSPGQKIRGVPLRPFRTAPSAPPPHTHQPCALGSRTAPKDSYTLHLDSAKGGNSRGLEDGRMPKSGYLFSHFPSHWIHPDCVQPLKFPATARRPRHTALCGSGFQEPLPILPFSTSGDHTPPLLPGGSVTAPVVPPTPTHTFINSPFIF